MKNEMLKALREYVDERKNVQYCYVQKKEDETISYDVIGFLANKLGFSYSFLDELNEFTFEYHLDNDKSEEFHALVSELGKLGFNNIDLIELQDLNDTPDSVEALLEYIDKMIEE